MGREVIFLCPSKAAKDTIEAEYKSTSTVWSVAVTDFRQYYDGSDWYVALYCSDANNDSLIGARDTGFRFKSTAPDDEKLLDGIAAVTSELQGDAWVYPDFGDGTKTDPGSWEASFSSTNGSGTIGIDTDQSDTANDLAASSITLYGRRVLEIKPPHIDCCCMLIVEADFSSAVSAKGPVLGISVSDTAALTGVVTVGGWQDEDLQFKVIGNGQVSALSSAVTKTDADRIRFAILFDGNQNRATICNISFFKRADNDAANKIAANTSEIAFDISSGCYLSLVFGLRNSINSGTRSLTYTCRYRWQNLGV